MSNVLFTVIAVHYQGTIPHEVFCRGIASIEAQTFKDYELICIHDGPLLQPDLDMPCDVLGTEKRANDWGHSLRHMGIAHAKGDYVLHFNVDNVLYPNALEEIAKEIRRPPREVFGEFARLDENNIVIFPIKMFGLARVWERFTSQTRGQDFYEILTGNPPQLMNIDTMQLVMRRDLWLKEGGWRDKSFNSDGIMYPEFCKKYGYRTVGRSSASITSATALSPIRSAAFRCMYTPRI
jgi:hypothetical protein